MTMTKKTIADETYYRAGQVFAAMQDGPGGRKRAQQAARGLLRAALSCCKVTGLNPAPMIGASTGQAAPGVPTALVTAARADILHVLTEYRDGEQMLIDMGTPGATSKYCVTEAKRAIRALRHLH
jgi:hypothetical protein